MTKNIIVTAIIALVVSLGVGFFAIGSQQSNVSNQNQSVQGLSERDIQAVSIKIGTTGTKTNQTNWGTCYILAYATTITASSTAAVDCQKTAAVGTITTASASALVGVRFGDNIQVTLSTTTAGSTFMGLNIIGAAASTTNGYISLRIANLTGTTFTWPTSGTATGTVSYVTRR